uniref:Uncharacterized protein n=1 Tax=Anguilla anguilla TaxID=7936 RepID=A0A0E9PGQ2_ANGAN
MAKNKNPVLVNCAHCSCGRSHVATQFATIL